MRSDSGHHDPATPGGLCSGPGLSTGSSFFENASRDEAFPENQPPDHAHPGHPAEHSSEPDDLPGDPFAEDASPDEAFPENLPPVHLRGQPLTWSPRTGWQPADDPEWVAGVDDVAALLSRYELASTHRLRAAAGRAVLSVPEFLVLSELAVRPDGMTGAHVADTVGVGSGGISGILTRLEEQDLIEREPDPTDARGMLSSATDAGRVLLHDESDELPGPTLTDLMRGLTLDEIRLVECVIGLVTDRASRQTRRLRQLSRKR